LPRHFVIEDPGSFADFYRPHIQCTHVHHGFSTGAQKLSAFGVGGHAIKVALFAPHQFPFPGGSQIGDVFVLQPVFLQDVIYEFIRHVCRVALTDFFGVLVNDLRVAGIADEHYFYVTAADIYSHGIKWYGHDALVFYINSF